MALMEDLMEVRQFVDRAHATGAEHQSVYRALDNLGAFLAAQGVKEQNEMRARTEQEIIKRNLPPDAKAKLDALNEIHDKAQGNPESKNAHCKAS